MRRGLRALGGIRATGKRCATGGITLLAAFAVALTLLVGAPTALALRPVMATGDLEGDRTVQRVAQAAAVTAATPWTPPLYSYRLRVQTDGIQALTYSDLAAANLPVDTLDPRYIRMFAMGQEIPIQVLGEADGHFDPNDVLLFYGRNVDSLYLDGVFSTNKYTGTNVYFLTYACPSGPCEGPLGLRMAQADGAPAGDASGPYPHREHVEKNFWYFSAYPFLNDVDHWYADWITESVARTYSVYAYNLPPTSADATLKLDLLGWGDNVHHLKVWVNNNLVLDGTPTWTSFATYGTTLAVPRSYLLEGQNKIKVGLVLDPGIPTDTVYLNWADLTYFDSYVAEGAAGARSLAFGNDAAGTWRYDLSNFSGPGVEVYNVTDWLAPTQVVSTTISGSGPYTVSFGSAASSPQRFLAVEPGGSAGGAGAWKKPTAIERVSLAGDVNQPTDLLSASNSADYILITHRDFWPQAQRLATHRDMTWRVALVDVQQIYDQFNGGLMSAEAIHDFLAYAHANWRRPAPMYVLLMGDGTNDMRNYRSTTRTFIPPYLYLADPDLGETAADNRFVTLEGNDNIPDMHIGRFPVNTLAEAQAMVDKTINYELGCNCDNHWNRNTLFVADDLEGGGGDFYAYSDKVADGYADSPTNSIKFVPGPYTVQKEYLGKTCDVVGNPPDAAGCRNAITTTLNTTGALFVSYVGHSTKEYWAVEHVFDKVAVNTLTNGPCLPIMLAMTCYEGSFFDYSTPETLAEASVRKPVSGAVASWSPTGFGLVSGHDYLEQGILLAWFHEGIDRLGAATTWAKRYLAANAPAGRYMDLLDTFVLLGDPGLEVKTEEACLVPTGVLASSFTAAAEAGAVQVKWETADESDVLGFNVLRRTVGGGFAVLNDGLILADHPGVSQAGSYSYRDASVQLGLSYEYRLQIVRPDGSTTEFGQAESRLTATRWYLPYITLQRGN